MKYENGIAKNVKIAYVGGGSRGWAWNLMNDLKKAEDISGTVYLYDIDFQAAQHNEIIGNKIDGESWKYKAVETAGEALTGADFVIISILPGTFDEMAVDVHTPEKYGIWQSVGDTAGPGGFIRALRTVPMMREIAANIRTYCPNAYVINFTNPMAVCIGALYREFPQIKAHGCCHEVFGTQKLLICALKEMEGLEPPQKDICVNVVGVNHFTWFTEAHYKNMDLFEVYRRFVDKFYEVGYDHKGLGNWMNNSFTSNSRVRLDLFRRFGYIAAAGDRHLAEFMDSDEYLASPETVKHWTFGLTTVQWRKEDLIKRLERSARLMSGEEVYQLRNTGEEAVQQIRAILGCGDTVTNVNLPNRGQISNLPMGTIVETNAAFRDSTVQPVFAGAVPESIYPLISRAARENDDILDAAFSGSLSFAYEKFRSLNMLKALTEVQKKALFDEMVAGTAKYLTSFA
ncbi:MAG: alpha-glucosidase/alpha-galactosidase [Oscillospiraceae bacterium]|nr:alpha-glucosidase/alpha-galactosidase [Oscillospiraceae bacterium]